MKLLILIFVPILARSLFADDTNDWEPVQRPAGVRNATSTQATSGARMKILIFMGSVREGRNAQRVAKFVERKFTEANYQVELIDPETLDFPLLKRPLHFYARRDQASSEIRDLDDRVKSADAYLLLCPEYNRQMAPALTNLIDHLPPKSYAFKASGIVAYSSGSGGLMAAAQARTLMVELGAPPVPYILHITNVAEKLDAEGDTNNEALNRQVAKLITQINWFAAAMRRHREYAGVPDWPGSVMSV